MGFPWYLCWFGNYEGTEFVRGINKYLEAAIVVSETLFGSFDPADIPEKKVDHARLRLAVIAFHGRHGEYVGIGPVEGDLLPNPVAPAAAAAAARDAAGAQ